MDLGILPDNKLISLVLQGYTPFQPEVGIFCGAYPGILYPNPTTLSYPNFDPYLYQEMTATEFTPAKRYIGLGVGNPGIDYKNPGHLLGIFDTFGRMSYGIGVWQAILNGEDGSSLIGPAVEIALPLIDRNFEDATISLGNIYPSLSEVPSAYLDHFSVSSAGIPSPDPRPGITFRPMGIGITPVTNQVDAEALNRLFFDKSVFSYLGLAQYFRAAIDALSTAAQSLTTKATHTFSLIDLNHWNNYSGTSFLDIQGNDPFLEITHGGTFVAECKVMGATKALKTLTNSSVYHNGENGQNEYRTFTELNSVMNLVPMQMFGASYTKHYTGKFQNSSKGALGFLITAFAFFDFVVNVSDLPPDPDDATPGTVTIDGEITVQNLITNTHALDWRQISQALPNPVSLLLTPGWAPNEGDGSFSDFTYGAAETVRKNGSVQISVSNDTSWDKVWLDKPTVLDGDGDSVSDELHRDASRDLTPLPNAPLVVPFNTTVALGAGATSVRVRVKAATEHSLYSDLLLPTLWVDPLNSNGPIGSMPEPPIFCHEHFIIEDTQFVLDYHCHFFLNTLDNFFVGDPMTAADDIQEEPFSVSLTVNGTRLDAISYEMSS